MSYVASLTDGRLLEARFSWDGGGTDVLPWRKLSTRGRASAISGDNEGLRQSNGDAGGYHPDGCKGVWGRRGE